MATDEDKTIVEAFFEVVKEQGFVFDQQSKAIDERLNNLIFVN